ncbi:MAG TPA: hypothetical protein VGW10_15050 [Solirubrobacteraceae bacterium]|nr:hypothetical protein [Solirubrobacteraceae bacterium]
MARVYAKDGVLWGCLRRSGRRRVLERPYDDGSVRGTWRRVRLRGRFVAWSTRLVDRCRTPCSPEYDRVTTWIESTDLQSGSRRQQVHDGSLASFEISRTGGIAYLLDTRELFVIDGGLHRVLDTDVVPGSVALRGSTLTWSSRGAQRTALVLGGTTCSPWGRVTRAWTEVVRAYERRGTLFGCAWLRAREVTLSSSAYANVEAAGRFVAWSEPGTVVVRDILGGREVRPAAGTVLDVALGGDGAVVWLEDGGRLLATRGTVPVEIASGAIEPGSLAVRRGVASWRQDGSERSAPVPA